jgi:hypothetical protein
LNLLDPGQHPIDAFRHVCLLLLPPPAEDRGLIEGLLLDALLFLAVLGQSPLAQSFERFTLYPSLLELSAAGFDRGGGLLNALLPEEQRVSQRFRVPVGLSQDADVHGIALQAGAMRVEAVQRGPGPLLLRYLSLQPALLICQLDLSLLHEAAAQPQYGVQGETKSTHR